MRKRNFFRVALHTFPIQIILQIPSPLVRSDKVAWQIETYCKIEETLLAFVRFVPLKVDKNFIAIISTIEKYSAFYKTKSHEWFCKNRHKMPLLEKKTPLYYSFLQYSPCYATYVAIIRKLKKLEEIIGTITHKWTVTFASGYHCGQWHD